MFGKLNPKNWTVGTKSLLFGVHQFLLHPLLVTLAWHHLYKSWPGWRELFCIFVHDLGYWGVKDMDGFDGRCHPFLGAKIARRLFGQEYYNFCIGHSRSLCRQVGVRYSKLCWADKCSVSLESDWFYLLRARLTGELGQYLTLAQKAGYEFPDARAWLAWYKSKSVQDAVSNLSTYAGEAAEKAESAVRSGLVNQCWEEALAAESAEVCRARKARRRQSSPSRKLRVTSLNAHR
jgi:hypothetical protein